MLLAGGDSFTWGNELPDCDYTRYSRLTWSAVLAKQMGLEYHCVAEGGASNQNIARNMLYELCKIPAPKHVAVMWTFPVRHELLLREDHARRLDKKHINISPWHVSHEQESEIRLYAENMLWLTSHEYHEQQSLYAMTTLASFLRYHNIPFSFSAASIQVYEMLDNNPHISRLIGDVWYRKGEAFYDWAKEKGYEISSRCHPVAQAHEDWMA